MASTGTEATDRLKEASGELFKALGGRALGAVSHSVGGLSDRLDDVAGGGPLRGLVAGAAGSAADGGSAAGGAVKGALSGLKEKVTGGRGGGTKGDRATKATTIIEEIDVGVPVTVAYNQWTEFDTFPHFMKKVEKVEAQEETKISWKAQIVWSHRSWDATVLEQSPDERIVWRSKGEKGHVDGAVTFHEIGPNLTRIVVVLEYYPQGLFERTGNIWRAQGRRVRAELQNFRRHVMTRTILDPDAVEGWRGEIHDGEVVRSHEEVLEDERSDEGDEGEEGEEPDEGEDEYDEEPEDEDEAEPEDDYEDEDEEPEEEAEDYEDEEEPEEEEPEDEDEEYGDEDEEPEDEQPAPRRRRR